MKNKNNNLPGVTTREDKKYHFILKEDIIMSNIKIKTADGSWKVVDKDWAFNMTCRMIRSWTESAIFTLDKALKHWNSQIEGFTITEDDYLTWLVNNSQD